MICIYILFPLIKTTFDNNIKAFVFFIVVVALFTVIFDLLNEIVLLQSTVTNIFEDGLEMPLVTLFNPFRGSYGYSFVYFGAGGLIFTLKEKILQIKSYKRNLIAVLGILINCSCLFIMGLLHSKFIKNEIWDIVWNGYDTIFTLLNVLFLYTLCLNLKKDIALIRTISCNTLGIYFIHNIFVELAFRFIPNLMNNFLANIIIAFMILLCSLSVSYIMKKIPLIKKMV